MINRKSQLNPLDQAEKMGELDGDHALRLEENFYPSHKIVEVRDLG